MKKLLLYLSVIFLTFVCNEKPVNAQVIELLKDVAPGEAGSSMYNFMVEYDGKLIFMADDMDENWTQVHGLELWVSDGTEEGTQLLKDINPGTASSEAGWVRNFAVCNNKLFFIANDGVSGAELWATDGTEAGTYLVKDVNPGDDDGLSYGSSGKLTTYNGKVYFAGTDGDPYSGSEFHGMELWCSDGTEEGTYMLKDIRPNDPGNHGQSGSSPGSFREFNGLLYFVAYDGPQGENGHGDEIWLTDGTEEGTHLFLDLDLAELVATPPGSLKVCGDLMFFTHYVGDLGNELWVTDGSEEGTHLVKDIYPGFAAPGLPYASNPGYLTNLNDVLFFRAIDENGYCLFKSDGTEEGTINLSVISNIFNPINLKVFGNQLIFLAYDGINSSNYELYSWTDAEGVQLVKEINPNPTGGIDFNPKSNFPEGFVQYKNKLYFRAAEDGYGTRLWETDGTENGTIQTPGQNLVVDIPDPLSPMYIMNFSFAVSNGSLFYPAAYDGYVYGIEVYKLTTLPLAYTVVGGGDYCLDDEGLPVGLNGSEEGVTYTLYKGGVAQAPTIVGTGEAISFGNQTAGIYTVSGANVAGSLDMEGSALIIAVTSIPVSVSIVAEDESVCVGEDVTFTAIPENGGASPYYQWYVNEQEIGEGPTYTYFSWIPGEYEIYTKLTSSYSCAVNVAESNHIILVINDFVTPEVTITVSENPVYSADPVTFTPTPVNAGDLPSYEWFVNDILVSTGETYEYLPINEDQVYVVLSSSLECVTAITDTSNVIEMIVNNGIPAAYTVIGGGNYCEGSGGLPVGLSDSEIGVLYTLYKDGVAQTTDVEGTGEELTFGDQPGGVYTVTGTNANTTTIMVGSAEIIEIGNLPVSVTIEPDQEQICSNLTIVFTAYTENAGNQPDYQWYNNGMAVTNNNFDWYSFVPVDGDVVYVEVTSSLECTTNNPATSEVYELEVMPSLTVQVLLEADNNNICEETQVTFTATPVNGGDDPSYYWEVNEEPVGSNQNTYTYIPSNGDVVRVLLTSSYPCAFNNAENMITVTVNDIVAPSVTITASENPVNEGNPVTFTPSPENGGDTPAYQWYVNGNFVSDGTTYTYVPENGDEVYTVMTSSLECVTSSTATSNSIEIFVSDGIPVVDVNPTSLSQTIDQANGQATDYLSVSNNGEGILGWSATIEYLGPTKTVTVPEGPQIKPLDIDLSASGIASASSPMAKDRETIVLNYDGDNYNTIGLQNGGSFSVAARYPSNMTSPYAGYMLESVDVYINDAPSSASLKIWGAGTTTTPGTLLLEQAFNGTGWLTIALTEPIEVSGSDIWVGYTTSHIAGDHPAGCDAGPANANGDWISTDGTNWDHLADLGYSSNWNIRANLTGVNYNWLSLDEYSGMVEANESQELQVYFDATGLSVNDLYTANILINSNDPTTPVVTIPVTLALSVGIDETQSSQILVYPNPATNKVNIQQLEGVHRIRMINNMGETVYTTDVRQLNAITLDSSHLPTGVYIIQFVTNEGTTFSKKIVILK